MSSKNTLRLFGLGGCGTNLVKPYIISPIRDVDGYATVEGCIVDTSESNAKLDEVKNFYKVRLNEDRKFEGGGGLRGDNHREIAAQVPEILNQFKPAEINVLVAAAAGASGSTLMPFLSSELVRRGNPTVLILIVDDNSLLGARNTLNTLASLDNMAKKQGTPLVVYLVPNTNQTQADAEVRNIISLISLLFSNQNMGLDNSDTFNFLNYNKVTGYQPGLIALRVFDKLGENYNRNPVTLAMVHTSLDAQEKARGKFVTSYSCEGIVTEISESKEVDKTYYFLTEFDDVSDILSTLKKTIEEYEFSDQCNP